MIPFDVDQAGWNSTEIYPDGTMQPWRPDKWVLHYGGGPNAAGYPNAGPPQEIKVLQSWQKWHIRGRGWQDIAYNYAIGQSGTIYRLRGENRAGATRGDFDKDGIPANHEARAVVFILGGDQVPTEEAYAAFRKMWQEDKKLVIGHQQVFQEGVGGTSTACPGNAIMEWIRTGKYAEDIEDEMPQFTEDEAEQLKTMLRILREMDSSVWFVEPAVTMIREWRAGTLDTNGVDEHLRAEIKDLAKAL